MLHLDTVTFIKIVLNYSIYFWLVIKMYWCVITIGKLRHNDNSNRSFYMWSGISSDLLSSLLNFQEAL